MTNQEEIDGLRRLAAAAMLSNTQLVDYWTDQVIEAIDGLYPAGPIVLEARLQRLKLLKAQLKLAITAKKATLKS